MAYCDFQTEAMKQKAEVQRAASTLGIDRTERPKEYTPKEKARQTFSDKKICFTVMN